MSDRNGKERSEMFHFPTVGFAEPRRRIALSSLHYRRMIEAALRPASSEDIAHFEASFAKKIEASEVIATSSGSQALILLFQAYSLKEGDEIIVPAYTDESILTVLGSCGLTPRFVDINPATHTLDPAGVTRVVGRRTRAILAAHLFGVPADMDALQDVARRHDLLLFEDCAHAIGTLSAGRPVGSIGHGGLFSFSYAKPFGLFGGGAVVCRDEGKRAWIRAQMRKKGTADHRKLLRNIASTLAMDAASHPLAFTLAVYPALHFLDRFDGDPLAWLKRLKPSLPQRDDTCLSGFQSRFGMSVLDGLEEDIATRISRGRKAIEILGEKRVIHSTNEADRDVFYFLLIRTTQRERLARYLLHRRIDTGHDVMRNIARLHCVAEPFPHTEQAIAETLQIPIRRGCPRRGSTGFYRLSQMA